MLPGKQDNGVPGTLTLENIEIKRPMFSTTEDA
jgi:hypothetical protein